MFGRKKKGHEDVEGHERLRLEGTWTLKRRDFQLRFYYCCPSREVLVKEKEEIERKM